MAGRVPFRTDSPAAKSTNATTEPIAAAPGKAYVRSQRTGDPLPEPSSDSPGHSPPLKWPQPAPGVDHKPMKVSK